MVFLKFYFPIVCSCPHADCFTWRPLWPPPAPVSPACYSTHTVSETRIPLPQSGSQELEPFFPKQDPKRRKATLCLCLKDSHSRRHPAPYPGGSGCHTKRPKRNGSDRPCWVLLCLSHQIRPSIQCISTQLSILHWTDTKMDSFSWVFKSSSLKVHVSHKTKSAVLFSS